MNKKLTRTTGSEAMILGVCGGLGKYFSIDPTVIRVIAALLVVFSIGGIVLAYLIMALIMPKEGF